jgi:hypothetical protein
MITAQDVPNRRVDVVLRPAAQVAPGAGAVLLDTGPIGPNQVYVEVTVHASADANAALPELVHRNAANTADLEVDPVAKIGGLDFAIAGTAISVPPSAFTATGVTSTAFYSRARVLLAAGERLLVRNLNAAAALETWQAAIDLWVL